MIGIKMFMPNSCIECPFYSGAKEGMCLVAENNYNGSLMSLQDVERQDWCPLVDIDSEG